MKIKALAFRLLVPIAVVTAWLGPLEVLATEAGASDQAQTLCTDIQFAELNHSLNRQDTKVSLEEMNPTQVDLLRQAAGLTGSYGDATQVKTMSVRILFSATQPFFSHYQLNGHTLDAVNLAIGNHNLIYVFQNNQFTGILQKDGSLEIHGIYCPTASDLF